jgi:hypothetical protein
MKVRSLQKIFFALTLCSALMSTGALISGCSDGKDGAPGANGHDATFGNSTCAACHHIDDNTIASSLLLPAYGAGSVSAAPTGTAGNPIAMFAKTSFTPTGSTTTVTAVGYYWSQVGGLPVTFNSAVTGPTVTLTINNPPDYLGTLLGATIIPDRTMIVPINSLMIEEASNAEIMVTIYGNDGKIYYDVVLVKELGATAALAPFANRETLGIANVALNSKVLLNAKGAATLTLPTIPGGSAAALAGGPKNPYFTPDIAGQYIVSDGTNTISIYAGNWRGAITGIESVTAAGIIPTPDAACTVCHSSSGFAPDQFTPWKNSGHAGIFSQNLNAGGHYGSSCFFCHTVGFKTGAGNNGFDLQPNYATFITDTSYFSPATDSSRYTRMWSSASYSALARETNIQCENCHGPQQDATIGAANPAHGGVIGSPRVSTAAEVCGACHGEPTRHGRFQQWQESPSGHANYDLAVSRGTSNGCAACHSAQGFLIYLDQLVEKDNPLRTIPAAKVTWNANTVQPQTCVVCHDPHAEGTTTTSGPAYSDAAVQTNAQTRLSQLMVAKFGALAAGDTPKLPTGFAAKGVGKGAQCMLCHNLREGGIGTTAADGSLVADASGFGGSYLHEDNSVVFGLGPIGAVSLPTLTYSTSYASPHDFTQAEVLMGHNAYFMGDSGGDNSVYKSPHAVITDTCVTCHMEKSPAPALLSYAYGGSNHTFTASMEICADCHGIDSGLGLKLQADTQALLNQTAADIAMFIKTRATGTLVGIVTAPATTVTLNIPFKGSIYSISQAKSTSLGAPSITSWDITLRSPTGVTIPDISSTPTPTVVIQVAGAPTTVTLAASGNTMITTNPGNPGTVTITNLNINRLVPLTVDQSLNFVLNKSTWNYQLIQRDYSLGVHNPAFVRNVLTRTSDELAKHLDD